jgi:hypothetical protein
MARSFPVKRTVRIARAPTVARQVKQILVSRVEHKNIASTTANIDYSASGVVSLISTDIAQGDDLGNRSGDSIRPLKLTFRICSFVTVDTFQAFRFIVFQDTMSYGATPAVTDVLNSANYLSPFSPLNVQAKRFKILIDHCGQNVDSAANQILEITKVVKMKGVIHYKGTGTGATSAGKNSLYALFINDATGTAGERMYRWSYQLEYMDA